MIPKVIHQIWLGSEVPDTFLKFSQSWQKMHPDWEYIIWSDKDFGWLYNQDLFNNGVKYVKPDGLYQFQSDLARYEILYNYGGVYIDMDTEPLKPIDELMDVTAFAVWEVKDQWIANGIMGSVKNNNFIKMMVEGIEENVKYQSEVDATHLAGPRYLSRMYFENNPDMTIYPTHYFLPYLHRDVRKNLSPESGDFGGSYAVHHWNHARTVRGVPLKK